MPVSLKDTGVLFGGTAPHGLKELYGETFGDGGSAPASGSINLRAFEGKFLPPVTEASGTWTHIAIPFYVGTTVGGVYVGQDADGIDYYLGIQSEWRIAARVGTDTSLNSHGPTPTNTGIYRPSFIWMGGGFLTPTQYSILPGSSGEFGYINVGIVYLNGGWVKTTNQTS